MLDIIMSMHKSNNIIIIIYNNGTEILEVKEFKLFALLFYYNLMPTHTH